MKKEKQRISNLKKVARFYVGFTIILCALIVALPVYGEDMPREERNAVFVYDPAGKVDPFKPFIEAKREKSVGKEQKRTTPLTPLEKYDINDLKLVGIAAAADGKNIAMVEDAEGKFYPVVSGTPIGLNRGRVSKIMDNQIIIIEEIEDFAGKHKVKHSVMKLKEKSEEEL